MKKWVWVLMMLLVSGCATQNLLSKTATGLLTARENVIGLAQTGDALCTANVIRQKDCDNMKVWYDQAQVAYKTGSDAILVWIMTKQQTNNDALTSLAVINSLVSNMEAVTMSILEPPHGGK
jgi:hypothetical protein